jgi:hypothetical protein
MMILLSALVIGAGLFGQALREVDGRFRLHPPGEKTRITRMPFGPTSFERLLLYVESAAFAAA